MGVLSSRIVNSSMCDRQIGSLYPDSQQSQNSRSDNLENTVFTVYF